MSNLLPFVISGVATGSIYGLAGTGLVLTYKTSGIFNFGYGAFATIAAYLFYYMHVEHNINWVVSAIVSIIGVGTLLGLAMEPLAARLAKQPDTLKIVGTIGIILLVQALAYIQFGVSQQTVPQFLPGGTDQFRLGGVNITYDQVIVAAIAVLVVALLYALFRWSRIGTAMRAVVEDPDLLSMRKIPPTQVRRTSWIIGSNLATLSGVLLVPLVGLNALTLTLLVVQAFGAAAFGYFSSIPLTFAGGLIIGIAADLSKNWILNVSWLAGLPASLPFIILFVVLLILPRRKLVSATTIRAHIPLVWRPPTTVQSGIGVVVIAVLAWIPYLVGTKLSLYTVGLTYTILLLSLGLLVKLSGQVSLCHSVFAAIGAVAFSQFSEHGLPWLICLILAALVAVPVGAIVAIPAIRLSGLFLGLATLGFGILVEQLLYGQNWMFTTLSSGRNMVHPSFAETPRAFYYVVLVAVVVVGLGIAAISRSRMGRLLRGVGEAPVAVSTMGLNINLAKLLVFCMSASIAAVAGALYGVTVSSANGSDPFYGSFNSLILLCMLVIAPFSLPWSALFIGLFTVIPGYTTNPNAPYWLNALFGVSAILVAVRGAQPSAVPVRLQRVIDRLALSRHRKRDHSSVDLGGSEYADGLPALEADGIAVSFGGLRAVRGISLLARAGRITGLIGPNGAGKTTFFNVCSGLQREFTGRVTLHDRDISKGSVSFRARHGLGRTFQRMELCDTLTVEENISLGRESGMAGARFWAHVFARPAERRVIDAATWSAMDICGLTGLAGVQAGALSTGHRRLVELARCLAGPFDTLLLDEPASGLDHEETVEFGDVLGRVVNERGVAVLLVEHDMEFVMRVCSYVYVLDFGELIFEGPPTELARDETVRAAYLGSSSLVVPLADLELQ